MKHTSVAVILVLLAASAAFASSPTVINDVGNIFTMDTKTDLVGDYYRMTWLNQASATNGAPAQYRQEKVDFSFTAPINTTVAGLRWQTQAQTSGGGGTAPNFTISIKADNAGNPGTALGTPWTGNVANATSVQNTPLGSVNLTAGQVYHVSFQINNIGTPTVLDYSDVQIRIVTADCFNPPIPDANTPFNPATFDYSDYQVRSYDGHVDPDMYAKFYDDMTGQWVTGASGHNFVNGQYEASRYEAYKIKMPLFGLYSDSTCTTPIPELTYGYNDYVPSPCDDDHAFGVKLMSVPNDTDPNSPTFAARAAGESVVFNDAAPTINSLKLRMFRGSITADKPITIQLRNATTNAVIASGTVDSNNVRTQGVGTQPDDAWVTVNLGSEVDLVKGQRYLIVALAADNMTGSAYNLRVRGYDVGGNTIGIGATSFQGTTDYLVTSQDSGATWTNDTAKDAAFAMGMWIKGDVNNDRIVNVQDLSILGTNWKQSGKIWEQGDFNGDGLVNVQDLSILGTHWKEHLPEPATMALVALGGLFLARRRR